MGYLEWIPLYSTILLCMFLVKLQSLEILHVHHSLPYMDIILIAILAFLLSFLNMVNKMSKWNTCSLFLFWICGSLNAAFQWHMTPSKYYFCRSLIFRLIWNNLSFNKVLCRYLIPTTDLLWLRGRKKNRKSESPTNSGFSPLQLSMIAFKWSVKHLGEIPTATESPI